MTDFSGALDMLNQVLQQQQPPDPNAPATMTQPPSRFDDVLSAISKAQEPPRGDTLAPAGSAPREVSPVTSMGQNVIDAMTAGMQGTSPHVAGNYQLAAPEEQSFFSEVGVPRNQQTQVALRDPGTGQYAVYERNPAMAETAAPALGRMLSYAIPETGIPAVASGATQALSPSQQLMQAFEKLDVTPSMPAVGQGIGSRLTANIVSKLPFFGGPVAHAAQEAVQDTGNAADRLATQMGPAITAEAPAAQAGDVIQSGISNFANAPAPAGMTQSQIIAAPTRASSFKDKAAALYDRFWQSVDPMQQVPINNTLDALKGPLDRFPTSPQLGAQITNPRLQSFFGTLAPGEQNIPAVYSSVVDAQGNPILMQAAQKIQTGGSLTLGELNELRSTIGRMLGDGGLVNDIPRADLKRVYGGISQDLEGAANAAGPQTAQAFKRANQYYSTGIDRIDKLEGLVKGSPEQTFAAVNRAASDTGSADAGLLQSLQRSLPPDEWSNVGAAILRKMGQPQPGQQSVLPGSPDFSAASFVTNWNKLSPSAKDTLFGANVPGSHRESLDALAQVSDAQKQVAKFANPSGSGSHAIGAGMAGLLAEHFFDLTSHPLESLGGIMGGYGLSKALMSPQVARALYSVSANPAVSGGMSTAQRALSGLQQGARIDPRILPYIQPFSNAFAQPSQPQQ